jgi:hypothetical protein
MPDTGKIKKMRMAFDHFIEACTTIIKEPQDSAPAKATAKAPAKAPAKARHKWSKDDDLTAFYISRFGYSKLPMKEAELVAKLGMPRASFVMKIANFKHLEGESGLSNYSIQSKKIYDSYRQLPEIEIRGIILKILQ